MSSSRNNQPHSDDNGDEGGAWGNLADGGGWLASGVTTNTYLPNIMIILELEPRTQKGLLNEWGRHDKRALKETVFSKMINSF